VWAATMEGSEGNGGGEELHLQPRPGEEEEEEDEVSGPSAWGEGDGSPGLCLALAEGHQDIGSTGAPASDGNDMSWEVLPSESEPSAEAAARDRDIPCGQDPDPKALSEQKAPAVPPRDEIPVWQTPAHHSVLPEKGNDQNAGAHPKGASVTKEQKHFRNLEKDQDHVKSAEMTNWGNLNRAGTGGEEIREGRGPSSRVGGDKVGNTQRPGLSAKSQAKWICQPNSYHFGGYPPQAMMTLEFVAVLSENCNPDKKSKICVVFYKEPGICEEFTNMEKRDRVIVGSARITLSRLRQGPIFYKYALVNTFSQERECELEHVSLENSDIPGTFKRRKAQFYRVLKIPEMEIKADGTWTCFEHIECSFPSSSTSVWNPLFKKTPGCKIQMEYLERDFSARTISWNFLGDMERRLDRYMESIHICLWDVKMKDFEVALGLYEAVRENVGGFLQGIIKTLKTKEPKLPQLLFVFHISFCYNIPLPPASIAEAEKQFQAIEFSEEKYEELRGKSKYFKALKEMCLKTTDGTLWIWLVPLLYAIKERAEDPFLLHEPPSEAFLQLRGDEEKQWKVLKMMDNHKILLGRCAPLAKKVMEMVALKNFTKDPLPSIWLPLQLLLQTLYMRIVDVRTALSPGPEDGFHVALESVATRMEAWFKGLCPSGSSNLSPKAPSEDEASWCLNLVYVLQKYLLEEMTNSVSFDTVMTVLRILGLFISKEELLQGNKEFQQFNLAEKFREFSHSLTLWLERHFQMAPTKKKSFLKNMEMWKQLLSVQILSGRWSEMWQSFIRNKLEEWLKSINENCLVDLYGAFLKMEKPDAELENYFVNRIIQWIRALDKSKEDTLKSVISVFLNESRPATGAVLSVLMEKMCSELRRLGGIDVFDENTDPVLANLLNTPGLCDLLSAVQKLERKFHLQLSKGARTLLSQLYAFFSLMGHRVLSGDIPCSTLCTLLNHEGMFTQILCTCRKFGASNGDLFVEFRGHQERNPLENHRKHKKPPKLSATRVQKNESKCGSWPQR
ncbi:uncharacterized protein LOC113490904, partial [Athene cunicularia]|uniref:uncharacterized protein LOC113490904 n=1 Tax=Athene cunicularia TaxID=194338 RepID=UPI000EF73AC9